MCFTVLFPLPSEVAYFYFSWPEDEGKLCNWKEQRILNYYVIFTCLRPDMNANMRTSVYDKME